MKRVVCGLLMLCGVALAGCQSDEDKGMYTAPKPLDKMSNEEWCGFYAKFIKNPQLSDKTKQVDMERMRARGCPAQG